ncbi:MAG TPA: hypothetical protein VGO21_03455, partial [Candidatus Paceibacterota bacterium]|nr:hypothetical protein [Candidatus Paceibacterota bacterium]
FFLSWKIALGGLIGFSALSKFLVLFSKELSLQTVGDLSRKISSENYTVVPKKKEFCVVLKKPYNWSRPEKGWQFWMKK